MSPEQPYPHMGQPPIGWKPISRRPMGAESMQYGVEDIPVVDQSANPSINEPTIHLPTVSEASEDRSTGTLYGHSEPRASGSTEPEQGELPWQLSPEERIKMRLDNAVNWVARTRLDMQSGAGRSGGKQLNRALLELRDATAAQSQQEGLDKEKDKDEWVLREIASMELASNEQVKLAERIGPKKASMLARASKFLQEKLEKKWVKNVVKYAPIVAAAAGVTAAVVSTGGIAGLVAAAPAIATKGLIGAGAAAGGKALAHVGSGAVKARAERVTQHNKDQTRARMDAQKQRQLELAQAGKQDVYETAYLQARLMRAENNARRRELALKGIGGSVGKAALKGAATGLLVGVGLSGFGIHTPNFFGEVKATSADALSPDTPHTANIHKLAGTNPGEGDLKLTAEQAKAAKDAFINNAMHQAAEQGKARLQEVAVGFEGKGNTLWAKFQDAAGNKVSNHDTWVGIIVGDGPKNGGLEQMNASGLFDAHLGGQAKMTPEGIKFSGDQWWVDKVVAKENLYIRGANGDEFFIPKGQKLTNNQLAASLKLLAQKDTKIIDADTVRETIDKEFNPTPEQLGLGMKTTANNVVTEFDRQLQGVSGLDAHALLSLQETSMKAIIDANAEDLAVLPEKYLQYLVTQLDAKSNIPPEVIWQMLEDARRKALQLV